MTSDSPKPHYLPWSDSFSVGVASLDADHRVLVDLINHACTAWAEGGGDRLRRALQKLQDLAAEHFEREEEILRGVPVYSALKAHAGEHRNRLAQLQRILESSSGDAAERELASFPDALIDWFIKQSIGHDAAIKAYFDNAR